MKDLFSEIEEPVLPFIIPNKPDFSVHWDEKLKGFKIKLPHGELFYSEHFFSEKISDRSFEYFLANNSNDWRKVDWKSLSETEFKSFNFKNIKWKHDSIEMFGKTSLLPRITSWYGDQGRSYAYSGIKSNPNSWNQGLIHIKNEIEALAKTEFNSVLMNWYRNGDDYLNWHADDEKELGLNPVICSVNFGAKRDFILRMNDDNDIKITIPLTHGSLLLMSGELQHFWQHSVPKRKKINEMRINLTFRFIN